MNIFFSASLRGKQRLNHYYQLIYETLQRDHTVFADHVLDLDIERVNSWTHQDHFSFYSRILKKITQAELVVVEMTVESINIGYELSLALYYHKPVIVLHNSHSSPKLLQHIDPELFENQVVIQRYHRNNVQEKIWIALQSLEPIFSQRLTINLPGHLATYLNTISEQGIGRSTYVRQLLEREVLNNQSKLSISSTRDQNGQNFSLPPEVEKAYADSTSS